MEPARQQVPWKNEVSDTLANIKQHLTEIYTYENRTKYPKLNQEWVEVNQECDELKSLLEAWDRLAQVNRKDLWRLFTDLKTAETYMREKMSLVISACTSLLDRNARLKEMNANQHEFRDINSKDGLRECMDSLHSYHHILTTYFGMTNWTKEYLKSLYKLKIDLNNLESAIRCENDMADGLKTKSLQLFARKCSLDNDLLYMHDRMDVDETG